MDGFERLCGIVGAILESEIIKTCVKNEKDREILLRLLQQRDRNFVHLNDNSVVFDNILRYLNLIRPLKIAPQNLVRIGGKMDGGYVMFRDENLAKARNFAARGGGAR